MFVKRKGLTQVKGHLQEALAYHDEVLPHMVQWALRRALKQTELLLQDPEPVAQVPDYPFALPRWS